MSAISFQLSLLTLAHEIKTELDTTPPSSHPSHTPDPPPAPVPDASRAHPVPHRIPHGTRANRESPHSRLMCFRASYTM
jgi:hypothetical protein